MLLLHTSSVKCECPLIGRRPIGDFGNKYIIYELALLGHPTSSRRPLTTWISTDWSRNPGHSTATPCWQPNTSRMNYTNRRLGYTGGTPTGALAPPTRTWPLRRLFGRSRRRLPASPQLLFLLQADVLHETMPSRRLRREDFLFKGRCLTTLNGTKDVHFFRSF